MRPLVPIILLALARISGAAEGCADLPLCARLAEPRLAFFVGEAVAERQRDGHQPEYRFQIREALTGVGPQAEYAAVETGEGPPPAGLLLVQARVSADGSLTRRECDLVLADAAAHEAQMLLRRLHSADASLAVNVTDARGSVPSDVRTMLDGPMSRLADRERRFLNLMPGVYRVTASAPGYRTLSQEIVLLPGSCPAVDLRLAGTAEIAGAARPGAALQAIDADGHAVTAAAIAGGDGRYRLTGLPPGRYVLSTGSHFYPGSPNRPDAAVIHLGPGGKVEINAWAPR